MDYIADSTNDCKNKPHFASALSQARMRRMTNEANIL